MATTTTALDFVVVVVIPFDLRMKIIVLLHSLSLKIWVSNSFQFMADFVIFHDGGRCWILGQNSSIGMFLESGSITMSGSV